MQNEREKIIRDKWDNLSTKKSNKAWISGVIDEKLEYSHEVYWETFYKTKVKAKRLSGTEDIVPIVISNLQIPEDLKDSLQGKFIEAEGEFCSRNVVGEDGKVHLELFLFVTSIDIYEREPEEADVNLLYLDGYICKKPSYRRTPAGREITDLFIAVNSKLGKSDYIPCISWGRQSQYCVNNLSIGERVQIYGRVQSREYFKKDSEDSESGELKQVYEVSIREIKKVDKFLQKR